jgi:sec-independent protein translocase protein TatB
MFDIGFWELVVVGVVALVVLGPERLPVVARKVGLWLGRMRRFVNDVKGDIDREMRLRDIREAIERDAGLDEIKKIIETDRHLIEDEQYKPEYIVKARADEPALQPPAEQIPPPVEEDFSYGLTDHRDYGLEQGDPPVQHENVTPQPPLAATESVSVAAPPQPSNNGSQTKPT